jgi:hypothetical protein
VRPETVVYPHSFLWHYLWIAPHALQAVIVIVMIRRRLAREFPMFLSYTIFAIVNEAILFILDHSTAVSPEQYWVAYWIGSALSIALRFAVVSEIFSHVFSPYPALGQLSRILFRWSAVVLALVGVVVAAYVPGDAAHPIFSGIYVVDRGTSLIQAGLLALLFLFASYFGLSWRSYAYGIAVGLGIFSTVDLAIAAMDAHGGPLGGGYYFDFVTMATYHCCVVIWLVYLLAPETSHRAVKELPKNNLEEWNAELQRLLLQ